MSKEVKLTREELYEKVWQKPTVKIAEEFGVSDVMIAKFCRKMDIPKPPLGYWRKIETGAKIKPTPLPKATDNTKQFVFVNMITEDDIVKHSPEIQELVDKEELPENQLNIAEDFNDAHPLVIKTKQFLDKSKTEDSDPVIIPSGEGYLSLDISQFQVARALLIMDALFKALEKRGYKVNVVKDYWGETTQISKEDQVVEISIREQIRKVKRELTPDEKKKPPYLLNIPDVYQPSGKLTLKIKYRYSNYATWNDRKNELLENRLNEIIGYVIGVIERLVEEKRQKEEEERQRQEAIRRREEETKRREKLEADANQWRKSENIRSYIAAYEAKLIKLKGEIVPASEDDEWLIWARRYADGLDPLNRIAKNNEE